MGSLALQLLTLIHHPHLHGKKKKETRLFFPGINTGATAAVYKMRDWTTDVKWTWERRMGKVTAQEVLSTLALPCFPVHLRAPTSAPQAWGLHPVRRQCPVHPRITPQQLSDLQHLTAYRGLLPSLVPPTTFSDSAKYSLEDSHTTPYDLPSGPLKDHKHRQAEMANDHGAPMLSCSKNCHSKASNQKCFLNHDHRTGRFKFFLLRFSDR